MKPRSVEKVIADLDAIHEIASEAGLLALEKVVRYLVEWEYPDRSLARALFGVLERCGDDEDSYGIFWSMIHLIEAIPGYEKELRASFDRRPTGTAAILLRRRSPRRGSADRRRLTNALRRKSIGPKTRQIVRDNLLELAQEKK